MKMPRPSVREKEIAVSLILTGIGCILIGCATWIIVKIAEWANPSAEAVISVISIVVGVWVVWAAFTPAKDDAPNVEGDL